MNNSLEKIDPRSIPQRKLYTGAEIPAVGLGTFSSDRFTAGEIADAVLGAAAIGLIFILRLFEKRLSRTCYTTHSSYDTQ